MHARTRQAVLVGMAVAALAAAGGVHAAESEAVPVSIEGKTFKVEAPVQTQVVTDGVARRVEAGTTANGAPVIVTRLSSRKKDPSADKAEENGQAQASNPAAGADGANGTGNAADAGITYKAKIKPKVVHTRAEDMEPFVIHAVTPHSVSMAWESDPSVVYNISRNGQPIAQVSGGKYVDETVSPGTEYQYSIEPATAAAGASGKPVACEGDADVQRFKGDDRGWSNDFFLDPNKNRTEVTVTADWRQTPAALEPSIHVSSTTWYHDGERDVRTAKPNIDWFYAVDDDEGYVRFFIFHDIGNPFCKGNSIFYKEAVEMWNDGSVRISDGVRRKAPRHEALVMLRFPGENGDVYRGPWRLLQMDNYGFECLGWLNRCGDEDYEASHSL